MKIVIALGGNALLRLAKGADGKPPLPAIARRSGDDMASKPWDFLAAIVVVTLLFGVAVRGSGKTPGPRSWLASDRSPAHERRSGGH